MVESEKMTGWEKERKKAKKKKLITKIKMERKRSKMTIFLNDKK